MQPKNIYQKRRDSAPFVFNKSVFFLRNSVADPELLDADPDPTFQADADPDPKLC